jgi:hypothetical protein
VGSGFDRSEPDAAGVADAEKGRRRRRGHGHRQHRGPTSQAGSDHQDRTVAMRVSDRFPLWQNLGRKIYEVVTVHHGCLLGPDNETPAPRTPGGVMAAPTRRLHAAALARRRGGVARDRASLPCGSQRCPSARPRRHLAGGRLDLAPRCRHHRPSTRDTCTDAGSRTNTTLRPSVDRLPCGGSPQRTLARVRAP